MEGARRLSPVNRREDQAALRGCGKKPEEQGEVPENFPQGLVS